MNVKVYLNGYFSHKISRLQDKSTNKLYMITDNVAIKKSDRYFLKVFTTYSHNRKTFALLKLNHNIPLKSA